MIRTPISLAILVLSLVAVGAHAAPVAITSCGQTVSEGVLVGDLDCSAESGFAVTLVDLGTLDLAGYQLTGTSDYSLDWENPIYGGAVNCLGECTVTGGGGAIVAPPGAPAQSSYSIGIYSDPSEKRSRVHLDSTTISGWSVYGMKARNADISNCEFTGNTYGVVIEREVEIDGCTFTGNSEGAHLFVGKVSSSTFDGNGTGFYVLKKVRLVSSSASSNQGFGYYGSKLIAEDSAIDNNCLTPDPGCADVVTRRRPRLINTSCATTYNDLKNDDWNVCSLD